MKKYDSVERCLSPKLLKFELWKKADEILCLLILRILFYPSYEKYSLSDAPDIISYDSQVGIEVTKAVDKKNAIIESAYTKLIHCSDEKYAIELKKKIKENGADYKCGILFYDSIDEQSFLKQFKEVVEKKILKINQYKKKDVKKIGLMVYLERPIIHDHSITWVNTYEEITKDKQTYDFIFFLYFYRLDYYDPINKKFESYEINQYDFQYLARLATLIAANKLNFDSIEWKDIV